MASSPSRDFLDPDVLARLGNLTLHARHAMVGSVAGKHRSPHRGSSVEFAEYRKYVPGDDTRRLDWRTYARSDRHYIKEFEADTNLRLYLVVDTSGSMQYGAEGIRKIDYAKRMSAALAYLAVKQGDAVGLSCAAETVRQEMRPRRSGAHLKNVIDVLDEVRPDGETGLVDALHHLASEAKQRALVVILSDLFVDPETLSDAFQHLRFRKHDVAVFHLVDPRELDLELDRPFRFQDLEGGSSILAEPSLIRDRYREEVANYFNVLDRAVRDAQVDYHRVDIHESYGDVLARFLVRRTPKRARR